MTPFARYVFLLDSLLAKRPVSYENRREEARRMKAEGIAVSEIARTFSVSRQTVRAWCAEGKSAFRHSPETVARYRELRAQKVSIRAAAKELGLCRSTCMDWEYRQCS